MCYIFNSDYGDHCNISLEMFLSLHFRELAICLFVCLFVCLG